MMSTIKIILASLLLLMVIPCIGQELERNWLAIETDPVSTALGARTLSVIVEPSTIDHWSLFLNVVRADFPDWMDDFLNPNNKGENFTSRITIGGGFALDYFPKQSRDGLYFGLINLFFRNEISRNTTQRSILTHNIIPRMGFRWYPFEKTKLYLNPFFGLRYEYSWQKESTVDGTLYSAAGLQPFGTLHLGYHF
ncbi:MAG: hypothetical protein AAFZ63_22430 [Bacteroidota bacterium]